MFALPAILFGGMALYLFLTENWSIYGIPPMGSIFEDLQSLTATVSCSMGNSLWNLDSPTCDPFGRPFNYPTSWVKVFGILHLDFDQTRLIGYSFVFLLFVLFLFWGWYAKPNRSRFLDLLPLIILSISGPVILLVERGNIDTLIFAGLTFISILIIYKRYMVASIFLVILSVLKIYPLGAYLLLLNSKGFSKKLIASLLSSAIFLLWSIDDLMKIRERTPFSKDFSFGVGVLPQYASNFLNLSLTRNASIGTGLVITLLLIILIFLGLSKYKKSEHQISRFWDSFSSDSSARHIFTLFAGVYLFSFILGSNYDYRLVILMPLLASIIRVGSSLTLSRILIWVIPIAVFFSFSLGKLSIFADLIFEFLTILLASIFLNQLRFLRQKESVS